MLKTETLSVLQGAGWFADRRIDTRLYQLCLEADGYRVSDAAMTFLAEFGGLSIVVVRDDGGTDDMLILLGTSAHEALDRFIAGSYSAVPTGAI